MSELAVGANEVFWWCSDGAVRIQRFGRPSIESVAHLSGIGGWLAIDAESMWIADREDPPTLHRIALNGGAIFRFTSVPLGPMIPDGQHLWIVDDGLYRLPKAGGAHELVASGKVTALAKDGAKLVFEQPRYGKRAAILTVDAALRVTTVVPDTLPSPDLLAGGGWAYVLGGGVRIDLASGAVDYDWKCQALVATSDRIVMRCEGHTVRVAAHGKTETTVLRDVPTTKKLFGGPNHLCWVSDDKRHTLTCSTY